MLSVLSGARFRLIYRGVDISSDLDPMVTSVSYTDHLHGAADEISVEVHDADGRWKNEWFPEIGDEMELTLFDAQGRALPCGKFELDEPNATGDRGGDAMTIRGVAAPISSSLRTEVTRSFEKQTTKQIVEAVAAELEMTVEGEINELFHERVTMRRERRLAFLKRLAEETGHYCNLRGSTIIFSNFASIDGQEPVASIFHGDRQLIDYDFRFNSSGTYSKGKATYLNQDSGAKVEHTLEDPKVKNGEELRISGERMESRAHAEARLKSAMHFANRTRFNGSVTLVGSVRVMAGLTVLPEGFGRYSDRRVINSSTHTIDRSGYETTLELVDARS